MPLTAAFYFCYIRIAATEASNSRRPAQCFQVIATFIVTVALVKQRKEVYGHVSDSS